jgi:hypothetical protein
MTRHGRLYLRDRVPPRSIHFDQGRFGRLFPSLPPFARDTPSVRERLMELGRIGGLLDARDPPPPASPLTPNPRNRDNPDQTAGITFLGQFLDHDVTFDPTSSLERQSDPEAVRNFRTPVFELDSVYGSGRAPSPHLYDQASPGAAKLLVDAAAPRDLPRNSQNTALIGDPRNDENLIVSQLHLAFTKFHNEVVDTVRAEGVADVNYVFDHAQRLVRWHYQWIVVHEYLPAILGEALVEDILRTGRRFYRWRNAPFIPVEFSVAAYRFGHSQVRPGYIANFSGDQGRPFVAHLFRSDVDHSLSDPDDLVGGKRAPRRFVDWRTFFDLGSTPPGHEDLGASPKPNKRIDTKLSSILFDLPGLADAPHSLAQRNLLRQLTFELPSGQRVARAMDLKRIKRDDLADLRPLGFDVDTPLWLYLLREAEVLADGRRLGPVGGRIVAEVVLGLLQGDNSSYLRQDPGWRPTFGRDGRFTMTDLLRFAKVAQAGE